MSQIHELDSSTVTSFSETPYGSMERITLQIGGKEMAWAVPKGDAVVQVVDAEDSSTPEHYYIGFRVQFLP